MKDYIPTEEDFETLLAALASHEKELVSGIVLSNLLKGMQDLNDEQAFVEAFSRNRDKEIAEKVRQKAIGIRDQMITLGAKLVAFRNAIRQQGVEGEIAKLIN